MTKTVFRLYLFALFFPVAAFGAVEDWSLAVMETASFLALALFFFKSFRSGDIRIYSVPGTLPLLLLLGYVLLQVIPLPAGVVGIVSPGKHALLDGSAWADGPRSWATLTLSKKATLEDFFRLASYASFYFLTVQLLSRKELLKEAVFAVIVFITVISLIAIMQHILPNGRIYWIRELTRGGTPFGPYVNRNHYAGLMGMVFPVALSLFLAYKPDFRYESFRERLSYIFNQKMTNVHILLGFATVLIAVSVFLSLSRGGIMSLSLAMVFFGILLLGNEGKSSRGFIFILLLGLIVYAVGWFGWDPIFDRFGMLRDAGGNMTDLRLKFWSDALHIISDFPITGTGFGTFEHIYPAYRTIDTPGLLEHAHNDYIELLSEGGIIAFFLFLWFFAALLASSFRTFIRRREAYCRYVFIGSVAGMISILVHSITDFNLQLGANGLFLFFISGLIVSSAHTRLRTGTGDTLLGLVRVSSWKTPATLSLVLIACLGFNGGILSGNFYFSSAGENLPSSVSREGLSRMRRVVQRASRFDPLEAKYAFSLANIDWRLSDKISSLNNYKKAVELDPANGEYLQTWGLVLSNLKNNETAEKLLRAGIKYDRSDPERYKIFASWLMSLGRKDEGLGNIRAAISLEPENTREYIALLVLYGVGDDEIRDRLPGMVQPHLAFADYLDQTGKGEKADSEYLLAFDYLNNGREVGTSPFYRVYNRFMKKGMREEALAVMQKAIAAHPGNAGLRLTAAGTYEKAGITYRAVEEYRQVLMIDPGNDRARKKLDELRK